MTWSRQKQFFVLLVVGVIYLQLSAWDEVDLAELRREARSAQLRAVQYAVEQSGYRDVGASAFHCRAPYRGERLVMQHAHPRDPGKGYRCTYWYTARGEDAYYAAANVTWSRSPDVVKRVEGTR